MRRVADIGFGVGSDAGHGQLVPQGGLNRRSLRFAPNGKVVGRRRCPLKPKEGLNGAPRAPGRAHSLGGERPLHTRQGEVLAQRQGCPSRGGIRRKPQAKRCSDEQPADRRRRSWVSRRVPAKPSTCTEGCGVNPTEISVKASAQYPGRSGGLPCATCIARCGDEAPEVSKGHSSVDSLGNQEGAKA